jgi:transposase
MNRIGRISGRRSSPLRGLLVEVARMVYRYNAWARRIVDRISRGMKSRKKVSIVARKLSVILWAMLRGGAPPRAPA